MGLFKGTQKQYYEGPLRLWQDAQTGTWYETLQSNNEDQDYGNYQFISLIDVINNFMATYVGSGKILNGVNRAGVSYHAHRALQELTFDTIKSCKSQEIEVRPSLTMPLPHDYVNYVKLTWVDNAGIEHIIYPTSKTSNPFPIAQHPSTDPDPGAYYFDNNNNHIISDSLSQNILHYGDVDNDGDAQELLPQYENQYALQVQSATDGAIMRFPNGDITKPDLGLGLKIGDRVSAFLGLPNGLKLYDGAYVAYIGNTLNVGFPYIWVAAPPDLETGLCPDGSTYNALSYNQSPPGQTEICSGITSDVQSNNGPVGWAVFTTLKDPSDTWSKYKSQEPHENTTNDFEYDDSRFDLTIGQRFGLDPQHAQVNGSYFIDCKNGKIHFSSNLAGKTIILKYISDSLGTDEEMQVHKFAEEAIYRWIAYGCLIARMGIPEYVINRFKKEKFAETRKAKLRLSNIKIEEISQIMRGKSKQIKH